MLLFILLLAILDAILGVVVYTATEDTSEHCFDHSKGRVARGFTGFNGIINIFAYDVSLPWLQVRLLETILVQTLEAKAVITLIPSLQSSQSFSQLLPVS